MLGTAFSEYGFAADGTLGASNLRNMQAVGEAIASGGASTWAAIADALRGLAPTTRQLVRPVNAAVAVGEEAVQGAATTLPRATDGTADSAYNSAGMRYGSATATDAAGNPLPTVPGLGVGRVNGGVVADEAAALSRVGVNANGPVLNGKAPNTVLNRQAVNDLANGSLPGITKNPNTGLPDVVPRTGVPREMPGSPNPSATAEDFANRLFGGTSTPVDAKPIPNCNGCWSATNADGVSVTYRPASTASVDTAASTASVDINFRPNGNVINGGKPVKLKFPQQGGQ